jgi:hypothetical protein
MKLLFTSISLLAFIMFSPANLFAQQVFELNSIDSRSKQITAKTVSGADHQRQYYTLHDQEINFSDIGKGDFIEIESEPGSLHTFRVTRVANYTPTTTSFITRDTENANNTFTFTYSSGRLHGIFHKSHEDIYYFDYDSSFDQNYVAKSKSYYDDEEFCSIHELESDQMSGFLSTQINKSKSKTTVSSHVPNVASSIATLDDDITIDLLMPYTQNAKVWAESAKDDEGTSYGSIEVVIAQSLAKSQTALDNSEIYITLRLVHYYETGYDEDSLTPLNSDDPNYISAGDHLRRLTYNSANPINLCSSSDSSCSPDDYAGFMEEAHGLRDQYGADLVAAVLSEPNTGGIAWLNGSVTGAEILGFSINRVQQIASGYTLVHEIGHNMGNAHARNQPSAEASVFGGMFVYSTGNRFSLLSSKYSTVMAYDEGGYTDIAHFSNPDVTFSGIPTGRSNTSTSEAGPSNSARSMQEIKTVIASYRPTVVDPPAISIQETSIDATLNQDNKTAIVPITIQNNGTGNLAWDLDFDIESGVVSKSKGQQQTNSIATFERQASHGSNLSFSQVNEEGVIYSTSFESGEGFSTGDFPAAVGWRSFLITEGRKSYSESAPFEISSENAADGSRHLRLPRRSEASGYMFAESPFFGLQPMGEFEISFDLATQDQITGTSGETFDVYVFDGNNSELSSAIIITNGNVFTLTIDEQNEEDFIYSGTSFPDDGTYQSVKIHYNPNNQTVDYYLEDQLIASQPYSYGSKPDYMWFGQRNDVSGAYMDVDNIVVERLHSPFNWLQTESFGGVIAPGESETVNLTLSAVDVETGSYETVLQVRSNDPSNPVLEIPITADVQMATSSELTEELPQRLELSQNYPNPFNPSTTIQFSLNRASDVTLEVFNITGQRIATLVNETLSAGNHQHSFDASGLSSGIYIYRLRTPEQMLMRQMILIK